MEVIALAVLVSVLGGIIPALINRAYARPLQQRLGQLVEPPEGHARASWWNRLWSARESGLPHWVPGTIERFGFFLLAYANGAKPAIALAALLWIALKIGLRWYPLIRQAGDLNTANTIAMRGLVALVADFASLGAALIFGALWHEPPGNGSLRFQ